MTRRIIDISMPLENDVISDPQPFSPKITYIDHEQSYAQMAPFFPGLKKEDLPDGEAWAVEMVQLITHNGTHLDAPYHFASTMNKGERAITIDEVPLDWCMQPGVKLDFRHFDDGYVVTAVDVAAELERIGHDLRPLDIVMVNTRAGSAYGGDDYVDAGCGMGYDATMYLLERGVRLTGTDAWSWDAPFTRNRMYSTSLLPRAGTAFGRALCRERRRLDHLGRAQGRARHRLLPSRETAQSGSAAGRRLHGVLLPGEDPRRFRRLDPRGRHIRRLRRYAAARIAAFITAAPTNGSKRVKLRSKRRATSRAMLS